MINDNKDLIFWIVAGTWLIVNILLWILLDSSYCFYSNSLFIITIGVLIIIKAKSKKFENWLNKEIKNHEKN